MNDQALTVWNALLSSALKLPGVRIEREAFLRSALGQHVPAAVLDQVVMASPRGANVSASLTARLAANTISQHRALATATSALTSLPGGLWAAGTLPADVTQFFWHVLMVSQKLAYLHGWPELLPREGDVSDDDKLVLTLFVGVVLGVQGSSSGLWKLSNAMSNETARALPRAPVGKFALRSSAIQVARWLGVKLTKRKLAEFVGRGVPLIGGAVGGTLTWLAFGSGAERLRLELERLTPGASPDDEASR